MITVIFNEVQVNRDLLLSYAKFHKIGGRFYLDVDKMLLMLHDSSNNPLILFDSIENDKLILDAYHIVSPFDGYEGYTHRRMVKIAKELATQIIPDIVGCEIEYKASEPNNFYLTVEIFKADNL